MNDELKPDLDPQDSPASGQDDSELLSPQANGSVDVLDLRSHRHECRGCGFIFDPMEGVKKFGIEKGTAFLDLDRSTFRCPVCRAGIDAFRDIGPASQVSGFKENLNYGFGINTLTPGQKNVLIFGGLAFAVACFLSLYSLN